MIEEHDMMYERIHFDTFSRLPRRQYSGSDELLRNRFGCAVAIKHVVGEDFQISHETGPVVIRVASPSHRSCDNHRAYVPTIQLSTLPQIRTGRDPSHTYR
jgi:hypothetical protein